MGEGERERVGEREREGEGETVPVRETDRVREGEAEGEGSWGERVGASEGEALLLAQALAVRDCGSALWRHRRRARRRAPMKKCSVLSVK